MASNNKTIAKNTVLLYIRMFVSMFISLFTSRVILQTLGVDDYGINSAVSGIVGMMSFLVGALSSGSARFITYGLGEGDESKLKRIFSTTLTAHLILAIITILVAETVGSWYLHNKMIIPVERMDAAVYVFHLSIVTAFFSFTQIPYNACIIAHEKMSVYAYVSIAEALLKLLIAYLLVIGDFDKLKLFATLTCIEQVGIIIFYRFYCTKHFSEVSMKLSIDKALFKEIMGFSSWSLFANVSVTLNTQGVLLLLNLFFAPAVVAARSISLQVKSIANQFVTNFQTASNPQIVKLYAVGDYEGSKRLVLETTKISFYMMFVLALPIVLTADSLLHLWLGIVPEYAVIFLQLVVIQGLFQVFDTSFYRALYAKGRIRENALISPVLSSLQFPVVYFLFKAGCSPVAFSWCSIVVAALLGLVIKPILIIKIVNYSWRDVVSVLVPCLKVTIAAVPIPVAVSYLVNQHCPYEFMRFVIIVFVAVVSVAVATWFLGLTDSMKDKALETIKSKIASFKKK